MSTRNRPLGGVAQMADATPPDRDRYVDLLRAFSILVVVVGHWLMAIVYFDSDGVSGANALDVVPGLWLLTWVLQVMPLFFLVGGFSNQVALRSIKRKQLTYGDFLRSRIARLIRPALVFIGVWMGAAVVVGVAFPKFFEDFRVAAAMIAKPLWFLAVYVLVVALAPLMLAVHQRYGARALGAMAAAAAFVDFLRIGLDVPIVGYFNFAFVWLFAHQLGFFYADGVLQSVTRKTLAVVGGSALGGLVLLTASGIYSPSMVGMASEAASNNSPPTICLILLTIWLTAAAMLLRPVATRWLQQRKVWTAVIAVNSMIMTVFLWHLTAALLVVISLYPLGFPQPRGGTAIWWAWRPVWIALLSIVLLGLVSVFARFERAVNKPAGRGRVSNPALIAGLAALVTGLAGLAQFGFAIPASGAAQLLAQPLFNAVLVAVGYQLLSARSLSRRG